MNTYIISAIALGGLVCATFAGETNYQSPIDGKSCRADWHTYTPTNGPATNAPVTRVKLEGSRLLSTEAEFTRGIDIKELSDFILKTGRMIDESLGATNDTFSLLVQTQLAKDKKPLFNMSSKGKVSQAELQKIYDGFGRLPDLRSKENDLRYELSFTITKRP